VPARQANVRNLPVAEGLSVLKQQFIYRGLTCILTLAMLSTAQEANRLRFIEPVKAPLIQEKKVMYTINFLFDECPAENWQYYDSLNRQIVIEFYDTYINVSGNIGIKGQVPVDEIEIRNVATSIVLTGKKSQLILHVKKQMHCRADCFGDTLRVVLWKELEAKTTGKKKKKKS
jgi:hypothetical protein